MNRSRPLSHTAAFLAAVAVGGLSSCGHDDAPDQYEVQISETFMPVSITVDKQGDQYLQEVCKELNMKTVVVTEAGELPKDPIGFSPAYTNINFSQNTLLLAYRAHTWGIDTYSSKFVRNNIDKTYDWYLTLGSSDFGNDGSEALTFTRFAIEVPKLPKNANVLTWWNLSNAGWGGGWD